MGGAEVDNAAAVSKTALTISIWNYGVMVSQKPAKLSCICVQSGFESRWFRHETLCSYGLKVERIHGKDVVSVQFGVGAPHVSK